MAAEEAEMFTSGGGEVSGVCEEDWPNPESSEAVKDTRNDILKYIGDELKQPNDDLYGLNRRKPLF